MPAAPVRLGVLIAAALAGCTAAPPAPPDAMPPVVSAVRPDTPSLRPIRTPQKEFVARQLQLARHAEDAGDLAAAEDHLEVLVLVEPHEAGHRHALEALRAAIRKSARDQWQASIAARRAGDVARARDALLRVLALQPDDVDAATALREIEQQAMARIQGERVARARQADEIVAGARSRAAATAEAYDLEQRLEIARAGDLQVGLRELRAWVDANPGERAGRQRAGAVIAERARDAEAKGQRESALALYDQAVLLAGAPAADWSSRSKALRKALGEQYYAEGLRLFRSDLAAAISQWETGVKYDPENTALQIRLREARVAQRKLQKIGEK